MSERSIKNVVQRRVQSVQPSSPKSTARTRKSTMTVEEAAALVDGAKLVDLSSSWLDQLSANRSVWESLYAWLEREHGAAGHDIHNRTFVGKELMDRLHAAEIRRIRRLHPTATKAQLERSATWALTGSGPHDEFVDERKLTGHRMFFVPEDVDVWGSGFSRRLEDPTKQANEAWYSLIWHLRGLGWQVVTLANREAYYKDQSGVFGTLALAPYDEAVWRWYVDHFDMRKRGSLESITPQRPRMDETKPGSTELTCASEELVSLSEWLAKWLVAYRGRMPLPALPIQLEEPPAQAVDLSLSPWRGGNVWTRRAGVVYAATRTKASAAAPLLRPAGST